MSVSILHAGPGFPFSESGPYSTAAAILPLLHCWPCRGRAEPIR